MNSLASEWLVLNRPQVAGFHSPGDMLAGNGQTPSFRKLVLHSAAFATPIELPFCYDDKRDQGHSKIRARRDER
jgi:hypothetical protein